MIICYYTELNKTWGSDELEQKMAPIPLAIRQNILLKRNLPDVQLSVCGSLLILKLLTRFGLNLSLADLHYNLYQRPYFDAGFDFNVSHSGNRIVCCATDNGKVGIDIELTGPVNFNYDDYFTPNEQKNIRADQNPDTAFFKYWTRKEALLKAVGAGVYTPLLAIDVSEDSFIYEGSTYYLSPIEIDPAYQSCIAHTVKQEINISLITL
jgi:4'-phosphopantetheinyl transferase